MAGLLDIFSDPRQMGVLGLASGLLNASGPSRMPVSLGQAAAQGLMSGTQAYGGALQTQQLQQQLAASQQQQKAIQDYAALLPPDQRGQFLVNPAAFIKTKTEGFTLGPGQSRIQGGQTIASVPATPTLTQVPVPGQPGVTQPTWLRPGEATGTPVGALAKPEILNPEVQAARKAIAQAGASQTIQNVTTAVPFNERLQGQMAESLVKNFETLQSLPDQIATLDQAKAAAIRAVPFVGSGGEAKLEIAKFLNNNLGTNIAPESVKNAEVFRSAGFRMVLDNLKKMDAQPSERQQEALQKAMGRLDTDPSALPEVIEVTKQILLSRGREHNRRVAEAKKGGATFIYDIAIPLPDGMAPGSGGISPKTMELLDKYAPRK